MKRILIVDDDEATRNLYRACLEDSYEVTDLGDPKLALQTALQCKPDLILVDLLMPKLSGFELCRTFSTLSFTQQIPIFVISAEDVRNKAFCLSLGASGYFEKPVDFKKLREALIDALLPRTSERRRQVRVQLKVALKLKGKDKDGKNFEVRADTENMSGGGFLCTSSAPMEIGLGVEVFLCEGDEHYLGGACAVRIEEFDPVRPRFGFHFNKTTSGELEKSSGTNSL